jgi:Zn-dependent alcohol dehydrogenase
LRLVGKSGVMVYTAVADATARDAKIDLFTLTHYEQQIRGALYGSCNPKVDLPKLLSLYQKGDLKLDELVTKTYTLDQINEGYEDLLAGANLRGMVLFDD